MALFQASPNSSKAFEHIDSPPGSPTLWRPGSTSYPLAREAMDPLQSKQELQKLYEQISENSYDLSLRDLVEPCYSISGNLKAIAKEQQPDLTSEKQKQRQNHGRPRSYWRANLRGSLPRRTLSFSFSFPGTNVMRMSRDSVTTFPTRTAGRIPGRTSLQNEEKPASPPAITSEHGRNPSYKRSASLERSQAKSFPYAERRGELNQRALSTSKVHPSNQCSSCSSYTIFFKSRCLVCGKLYCSNCAKAAMENMSDGRKCKDTCTVRPSTRRFSIKGKIRCWPFCCTTGVQKPQSKTIKGATWFIVVQYCCCNISGLRPGASVQFC